VTEEKEKLSLEELCRQIKSGIVQATRASAAFKFKNPEGMRTMWAKTEEYLVTLLDGWGVSGVLSLLTQEFGVNPTLLGKVPPERLRWDNEKPASEISLRWWLDCHVEQNADWEAIRSGYLAGDGDSLEFVEKELREELDYRIAAMRGRLEVTQDIADRFGDEGRRELSDPSSSVSRDYIEALRHANAYLTRRRLLREF